MPKAKEIASDVLKIRRLVAALLLVFGLPFILQQSVWPLMRMGMFAEPFKTSSASLKYELQLGKQMVDPRALGMSPSQFSLYAQRVAIVERNPEKLLQACLLTLTSERIVISPIRMPENISLTDSVYLLETSGTRRIVYSAKVADLQPNHTSQ